MLSNSKTKVAVILANLGGPDSLSSVRPFLFNLFYDRAIIDLPNPWRFLLARWISFARAPKAKGIYSEIGGMSPILKNTTIQANCLEESLAGDYQVIVLPMMRYWNPRAAEVVDTLETFNPDKVILIPLYPQFSKTTTQSTIDEWNDIATKWKSKTFVLKSHYDDPDFIKSHQDLISPILSKARTHGTPKILFSAHSLPQKVIDGGDVYQNQIEATASSIMKFFDVDYVVCYQSKVGALKWLEPTIDVELQKAAKEQRPVVIVPISFVSEHSETLVELDIDYATKAKELGIPFYGRVPALANHPLYIKCLENAVRNNLF
jgi:ferrochelatase